MSTIKPFSAVRPKPAYAARVAALPYDVMNSAEARQKVRGNPYSFLHVDKAEVDLPEETDLYADIVYETAAKNLKKLESDGICLRETEPKLYVYRLSTEWTSQTGIMGCASVDEYLNGTIKRHELTRAEKEKDRIRHVDACNANTGPIFLAYRHNPAIDAVLDRIILTRPVYDFVSEGHVRHEVWIMDDPADIAAVTEGFKAVEYLYIADGHHRAASAVRVAEMRRKAHPGYRGDEEFNFFLAVYFRAEELQILDYNRLLKDTNGLSDGELLQKLAENFEIRPEAEAVHPKKRHEFGMLLRQQWYRLTLKDGIADESDPVASLDVSLLQTLVNAPVFGVDDPRTDSRIEFVGGIRGLRELERRCREDMTVAFSMFPTSLEELMQVADAGKIMPPKSTWFEPKPLSGLFIHYLE